MIREPFMAELVWFNHVPKCGGTTLGKILYHEFGSSYKPININSNALEITNSVRCIRTDIPWHHRTNNIKNIQQRIAEMYDKVHLISLIRHPISRIISGVKHTRDKNKGDAGFFPYLRSIKGPYIDQTFRKFYKEHYDGKPEGYYCSPSANLVLSSFSTMTFRDPLWTYGQSLVLSLGDWQKIEQINTALSNIIHHPNINISPIQNISRNEYISDQLNLSRYELIGCLEKFNMFLVRLNEKGIISSQVLASYNKKPFIKSSGDTNMSEHINDEVLLKIYKQYPIDFTVWDFIYSN